MGIWLRDLVNPWPQEHKLSLIRLINSFSLVCSAYKAT